MDNLGMHTSAKARSEGYFLLSRLFHSPGAYPPLEIPRSALAGSLPGLRTLIPSLLAPDTQSIHDEYHGLFFRRIRPNESTFLHLDPQARETLQKELAAEFASHQVMVWAEDGPIDGVTRELAFMAILTTKEGLAWSEHQNAAALGYREVQRKFLRNHLGRWYGPLALELWAAAQTPFFRSTARFLQEFVAWDIREELHIRSGGDAQPAPDFSADLSA